MSKTLTTTAEIRANDGLSGAMHRMAAASNAAFKQIQREAMAMNSAVSSLPIFGGALGGLFTAKNVFGDEVEWSKQVQLFKAISGIGDDWAALEKTIYGVSDATSISREKVLSAAKGWVELGGSVKALNKDLLTTYTNFSRLAEIEAKTAMKESRAFGIAYKMDVNDPKVMKDLEDLLITAIKRTPGGGHAMMEFLKKAAPAGATVHVPKEQLLALGTMFMREGFEGGDAGRAASTGLLRMIAQTKEVRRELEAAGVKLQDMYNTPFREGGMIDTLGLRRRLEGGGYMSKEADAAIKRFETRMGAITEADIDSGEFDLDAPIRMLKGELSKTLKKSGLNPDTIVKLVDQQVMASMGDLNLDKTLQMLGKLPVVARQKLLGKEHFPKWEPVVQNFKMLKEIEAAYAPDKVKDNLSKMTAELNKGVGFQWDRLKNIARNAFLGNFSEGDKNVNNDLGAIFKWLGDNVLRFSKGTEGKEGGGNNLFRAGFWGATGIAAFTAATFALKAFGGALRIVLGPLGRFVGLMGTMQTGPFSMLAGGLGSLGGAVRGLGIGFAGLAAGGALLGLGRIVGMLASVARFAGKFTGIGLALLAFENFDGITNFLGKIGESEAFGKLKESLGGLGSAIGGLLSDIGSLAKSLAGDWLPADDSGLLGFLKTLLNMLTSVANAATSAVNALRSLMRGEWGGASTVPPIAWDRMGDAPTDQVGTLGEITGAGRKALDWFKSFFSSATENNGAVPGTTLGEMPPSLRNNQIPKPFGPGDRPVIGLEPGTMVQAQINGSVPVTVTSSGEVVIRALPGTEVVNNGAKIGTPAGASSPAQPSLGGIKR